MKNQDTIPPPPNYEQVIGSTRPPPASPLTLDQMVQQALSLDEDDFELVVEEGLKIQHRPSTPPPLPHPKGNRERLSNPNIRHLPLPKFR